MAELRQREARKFVESSAMKRHADSRGVELGVRAPRRDSDCIAATEIERYSLSAQAGRVGHANTSRGRVSCHAPLQRHTLQSKDGVVGEIEVDTTAGKVDCRAGG
jgi:hypothetical protein